MQFRDLSTQYNIHKKEINDAIAKVLDGSTYIMGPEVKELEKELANYVGVKHCVSCANGTDALQLALMAWGIGEGDAVFVPDFTFFSTAEVVACVGATPVFVDIDDTSFNICPKALQSSIDYVLNNTDLSIRAVIAVDLFGQPADYSEIRGITEKYGLLLLEDGAQGFGGRIGDRKACSFGDISTTSFFPAKPLGCYGDGGAIFTNDDEWEALLRSFRVHGKGIDKYDNVRIGMNSRIDTVQAAVLLEKLKFFDDEIEQCQNVAKWYYDGLKNCESLKAPMVRKGFYSSWAQYTVLLSEGKLRDAIIARLKENDVPAMIYYRIPMHEQTAFSNIGINPGCKHSSSISQVCLSLPMGPYVKETEVERICSLFLEMCD